MTVKELKDALIKMNVPDETEIHLLIQSDKVLWGAKANIVLDYTGREEEDLEIAFLEDSLLGRKNEISGN